MDDSACGGSLALQPSVAEAVLIQVVGSLLRYLPGEDVSELNTKLLRLTTLPLPRAEAVRGDAVLTEALGMVVHVYKKEVSAGEEAARGVCERLAALHECMSELEHLQAGLKFDPLQGITGSPDEAPSAFPFDFGGGLISPPRAVRPASVCLASSPSGSCHSSEVTDIVHGIPPSTVNGYPVAELEAAEVSRTMVFNARCERLQHLVSDMRLLREDMKRNQNEKDGALNMLCALQNTLHESEKVNAMLKTNELTLLEQNAVLCRELEHSKSQEDMLKTSNRLLQEQVVSLKCLVERIGVEKEDLESTLSVWAERASSTSQILQDPAEYFMSLCSARSGSEGQLELVRRTHEAHPHREMVRAIKLLVANMHGQNNPLRTYFQALVDTFDAQEGSIRVAREENRQQRLFLQRSESMISEFSAAAGAAETKNRLLIQDVEKSTLRAKTLELAVREIKSQLEIETKNVMALQEKISQLNEDKKYELSELQSQFQAAMDDASITHVKKMDKFRAQTERHLMCLQNERDEAIREMHRLERKVARVETLNKDLLSEISKTKDLEEKVRHLKSGLREGQGTFKCGHETCRLNFPVIEKSRHSVRGHLDFSTGDQGPLLDELRLAQQICRDLEGGIEDEKRRNAELSQKSGVLESELQDSRGAVKRAKIHLRHDCRNIASQVEELREENSALACELAVMREKQQHALSKTVEDIHEFCSRQTVQQKGLYAPHNAAVKDFCQSKQVQTELPRGLNSPSSEIDRPSWSSSDTNERLAPDNAKRGNIPTECSENLLEGVTSCPIELSTRPDGCEMEEWAQCRIKYLEGRIETLEAEKVRDRELAEMCRLEMAKETQKQIAESEAFQKANFVMETELKELRHSMNSSILEMSQDAHAAKDRLIQAAAQVVAARKESTFFRERLHQAIMCESEGALSTLRAAHVHNGEGFTQNKSVPYLLQQVCSQLHDMVKNQMVLMEQQEGQPNIFIQELYYDLSSAATRAIVGVSAVVGCLQVIRSVHAKLLRYIATILLSLHKREALRRHFSHLRQQCRRMQLHLMREKSSRWMEFAEMISAANVDLSRDLRARR